MAAANFFTTSLSSNKAILAPMAGFSDAPFRFLSKGYGTAWAVTEMVSAKAIVKGNFQGIEIAEPYKDETDFVIQVFGSDHELIAEAAEILLEKYRPEAIDINMGCPVKKITSKGMGSSLMQDPPKAAKIINTLSSRLKIPVSVKMRLGYKEVNASLVAQTLEDAGADLIAIHGRTAEQKYSGITDWEEIARINKLLKIPVVGSGDISTKEEFDEYSNQGLGVMIARASLGKPWIFAELRGKPIPDKKKQIEIIFEHAVLHTTWYKNIGLDETTAMRKFRSKLLYYLNFLENKDFLKNIDSLADLKSFLEQSFDLELNRDKIATENMQRRLIS